MSKILIIDDDPLIVAIYEKMFLAQDFAVATANDGEQGLVAIRRLQPDVVLLDLTMPNVSGLELLHQIRSEPGLERLPVVVFCAGTLAGQVVAAWQAMATCVLMKGRDKPQRVLQVVKAVLAGSSAQEWQESSRALSQRLRQAEYRGGSAVTRVLMIDDDPVMTAIYVKMLRTKGFDVEVAEDGEQGLQSVQWFAPDVVLLDLDMPKMNGVEWLTKIRSRAETRSLPVVILTAGAIKQQRRAAMFSDATFMLAKAAVHPDTVAEAINLAAGRERVLS